MHENGSRGCTLDDIRVYVFSGIAPWTVTSTGW
jgi:hypothetical protein